MWLKAHPRVAHDAMCQQVLRYSAGPVDGNSEADPDAAPAWRKNGAVHANDFANSIDERPARIARVDRGVGLNHVDVDAGSLALRSEISSRSADDSDRHARLSVGKDEPVWIADCDRPLANHQVAGGAEWRNGEILGVDLEHGEIVCLVDSHQARGVA